jgi:hypothetical protein
MTQPLEVAAFNALVATAPIQDVYLLDGIILESHHQPVRTARFLSCPL